MNRLLLVGWAAAVCVAAMAVSQFPALAATESAEASAATSDAATATGEVSAVDIQSHTITLRTGLFAAQEFVVNAQTTISDGGEIIGLQQLRPGQKVTVQYVEDGGRRISQVIQTNVSEASMSGAVSEIQEAKPLPNQG